MSDEYQMQSEWNKPSCCAGAKGGIKAIMIIPTSNETEPQLLARIDPLLQVCDIMTEKGDKIQFGQDTTYYKLSNG